MDGGRLLAGMLLHLLWLLSSKISASDHDWSYAGVTGPSHWKKWFPDCGGKQQSPIDLKGTKEKKSMTPLTLRNYDKRLVEPRVSNNGHTLKLTAVDVEATMSGGCLEGEYKFHSLHYHWASTNSHGSEHTVNGNRYAMELHLVHVNSKYESLSDAVRFPDGLAVLGVFYQVRPFNSSSVEAIVKAAESVQYLGWEHLVTETVTLESLLPLEQNRFYCYRNGSLTTPSCQQSVTWTLLASPVHIGQKQMDVFRNLHFGNSSSSPKMVDNYRPVQDTNKRKIYFFNDASALKASIFLCALFLIISSLTNK